MWSHFLNYSISCQSILWSSCFTEHFSPQTGSQGALALASWSDSLLHHLTPESSRTDRISLSWGDGRGVTRYRDYEKSQCRRLFSPMPWLTEWFSHPLMQFSGWYSLTMVSIHQLQIGSHRAVLISPSPPQWFDMRFLVRWWWWRSIVWLLVMFVGAVVREAKQPNPNPNPKHNPNPVGDGVIS